MDKFPTISIGTCTFGPVVMSQSHEEENKYSIAIIHYDSSKHLNLITCKTTSHVHERMWPGEFMIDDLFGCGKSKIQPYNIIRIRKSRIGAHRRIGNLDPEYLPRFELGLRGAIKKGLFDAKETLDLADSWRSFFKV